MGYVKIHHTILGSSIFEESAEVFRAFIAICALADPDGIVHGSISSISRTIGRSIEETENIIAVLTRPDPASNCRDFEGRRLIPRPDGGRGWLIVTYEYYRDLRSESDSKARSAARQERRRNKNRSEREDPDRREKTDANLYGYSGPAHPARAGK